MFQIFRWLLRILLVVSAVILLVLGGLYWFASRSIPDYSGTYSVTGLTAPVEVVRDTANVPHIFGDNDPDVYFGLGYVHAQDRLWQMTMLRRTAQGRLSEIFGERTLQIDELIRRLDLYGLSIKSKAALEEQTLTNLDAYSAGVNAWLAEVNSSALGRGAPEFWIFPRAISPWTPSDSIALIKLFGLQLSGHLSAEVRRARASLILDPERVRDLIPDAPGGGIAALPEYAALALGAPKYAANTRTAHDPLSPFAPPGLPGASNGWAAAPSRSAAASTLLANDPHLGLTAPAIWYLARMDLQSGGVIGGTIPGIPAVMVGRSASLGWGITSSYLDDQDAYIEKLNPDDTTQVLTPGGWQPMVTRPSIITIKDAPSKTIQLAWTDNGPILPGGHYDLGTVTPPGHLTSLAWTVLSDKDTSIQAAMKLMAAQDVTQGIAAGAEFVAPSLNLVLADRTNIAMKTIGQMPRRSERHQSRGRMPTPGWIADNRWLGTLPYGANPAFVAPVGGLLGNTNNKLLDRPFPLHVSYDWGDTQRIQRWRRLMQNREVHTRESFIEAQLDTVSYTARTLLPLIAADLWFTGQAAAEGTLERQRQRALELLAEWNGEMNEHLPEPLIYAAWLNALQVRLTQDELGPLAGEFERPDPIFIERVFRNTAGAGVWCDVAQSAPVETCADISRDALDDALLLLEERYGNAVEALRWGDAHQAAHDHPVLGEVPGLNWIVNIRQSTSGGDNTLRRGSTRGDGADPFTNVHAAGYRGVYDFADPDSSVFIISTGQSGHPLSRHYDDLGELWRRGEYIPMSLDAALARAAATGVTLLEPALVTQ